MISLKKLGLSFSKLKISYKLWLMLELKLKLKLVTTSPVGEWTKTKLILNSTQVEVVAEVGLYALRMGGWFGEWVAGGLGKLGT